MAECRRMNVLCVSCKHKVKRREIRHGRVPCYIHIFFNSTPALAVAVASEARQRNGLLQGGKAAAETILEMRAAGDFSAASTSVYQQRWMQLFGHDFAYVSADALMCAVRLHLLLFG